MQSSLFTFILYPHAPKLLTSSFLSLALLLSCLRYLWELMKKVIITKSKMSGKKGQLKQNLVNKKFPLKKWHKTKGAVSNIFHKTEIKLKIVISTHYDIWKKNDIIETLSICRISHLMQLLVCTSTLPFTQELKESDVCKSDA